MNSAQESFEDYYDYVYVDAPRSDIGHLSWNGQLQGDGYHESVPNGTLSRLFRVYITKNALKRVNTPT